MVRTMIVPTKICETSNEKVSSLIYIDYLVNLTYKKVDYILNA